MLAGPEQSPAALSPVRLGPRPVSVTPVQGFPPRASPAAVGPQCLALPLPASSFSASLKNSSQGLTRAMGVRRNASPAGKPADEAQATVSPPVRPPPAPVMADASRRARRSPRAPPPRRRGARWVLESGGSPEACWA